MLSTKMKMSLLVATHVGGGILLRLFRDELSNVVGWVGLLAIIFADTGLIGLWGGLSSARLAWRLPVIFSAILYLWVILSDTFDVWAVLSLDTFDLTSLEFLVIALSNVAIVMVLVGLRYSPLRLRLAHFPNESHSPLGFQFSIRSLLLVTATVAVVLGIGRGADAIKHIYPDAHFAVIFPLGIISVTLAVLWATLGKGRLLHRLMVVLPAAFVVGTIPTFYETSFEANWRELIVWPSVFGFQAIITAASLLVVRSCGWRLVSGATGDSVRSDGNDAATLEAVGDDQSPWMKIGVQKLLLKVVNP